jgi:hypothetical protein
MYDLEDAQKRMSRRIQAIDYNPFSVGQPGYHREVDEMEERARLRQETAGIEDYSPF